jgi:hypothetical protein
MQVQTTGEVAVFLLPMRLGLSTLDNRFIAPAPGELRRTRLHPLRTAHLGAASLSNPA